MLQATGAVLAPLALLWAQATYNPTPYAKCMAEARERQNLSVNEHYATGQWQIDDAYCALQQ